MYWCPFADSLGARSQAGHPSISPSITRATWRLIKRHWGDQASPRMITLQKSSYEALRSMKSVLGWPPPVIIHSVSLVDLFLSCDRTPPAHGQVLVTGQDPVYHFKLPTFLWDMRLSSLDVLRPNPKWSHHPRMLVCLSQDPTNLQLKPCYLYYSITQRRFWAGILR